MKLLTHGMQAQHAQQVLLYMLGLQVNQSVSQSFCYHIFFHYMQQ